MLNQIPSPSGIPRVKLSETWYNGFGEKPVLKLMFGALVRAAERWRGLRFTEFEMRQIAAVRKDLDDEYEAAITRSHRTSQPRVSSKSMP